MPSGYRFQNVDFDDLFDPDVRGDGPSVPSAIANGAPLRYAAIQYGSKRGDVGYSYNGQDVSNLWAQKGSAVYTLGFNGKYYSRSAQALSGQTGQISCTVSLLMQSNGTWSIGGGGVGNSDSGTWLPAGASVGDYEVQFVWSLQSGASPSSVENGASGYSNLGANRVLLFTNTVNAALITSRSSTLSVTVNLRRISTGQVTVSTCSLNVFVQGQG